MGSFLTAAVLDDDSVQISRLGYLILTFWVAWTVIPRRMITPLNYYSNLKGFVVYMEALTSTDMHV